MIDWMVILDGDWEVMRKMLKKVVLDTTALIFLSDFSRFDEVYTVQEVVEEVKDRLTSMKLSVVLEKMKVIAPEKRFVDEIAHAAEETGDAVKLSNADINILALARQKECTVLSDDHSVQNVAKYVGIMYASAFNPEIKRLMKWKPAKHEDEE